MKFPEGVFTDIRTENIITTRIEYVDGVLQVMKTRKEQGSFIRVFDGKRWYTGATTDSSDAGLQKAVDNLASLASRNSAINEHPVVQRLEANTDTLFKYNKNSVADISEECKDALLKEHISVIDSYPELKNKKITYLDKYIEKTITSSRGANVRFDRQNCCIVARYSVVIPDKTPGRGQKSLYKLSFDQLNGLEQNLRDEIEKDIEFTQNAVPVKPGTYTCVLTPKVAGVFAHESFGHKSESDFMLGDAAMAEAWKLGTRVGSSKLSILDSGCMEGSGYVPYDDEGTRCRKTWLIRDGILSGRLHSAETAASLSEELTGNARAINFFFEPIVRMTNTWIDSGDETVEELFAKVKEGVFIDTFYHGSGMSTFTIAPARAYMIRDGRIAEPVRVSVITGNVMKTLGEIDGLSNEVEFSDLGTGGCGKMEQYPLSVGFGGPYVRVNNMEVQ
jgi:TldD protein